VVAVGVLAQEDAVFVSLTVAESFTLTGSFTLTKPHARADTGSVAVA
jgi:hypothetical protein